MRGYTKLDIQVNSLPLIDFAVSPLELVRIGFIGLGGRGLGAVTRYTHIEGAQIAALCDVNEEAVAKAATLLESADSITLYSGEDSWKRICED